MGVWTAGTQITLEASGAQRTDDGWVEAADVARLDTDDAGFAAGIFEFATDGTDSFSGSGPTAGARVVIYEQKASTAEVDSPDPSDADFPGDFVCSIKIMDDNVNGHVYYSPLVPIHVEGAKYWLYWKDGGAGSVTLESGWSLKLTPYNFQ